MELSVNGPTLVIQILNFLILLVALRTSLYEPMVAAIGEREKRVRKNLDDAEAVNRQALALKEEYQAKVQSAHQEAAGIVAQATRDAEHAKGEQLEAARREAALIVEQGRLEVARERDAASAEVRGRVVDLSVQMATHLLRDSVDANLQKSLVEQFVKKAERIHVG